MNENTSWYLGHNIATDIADPKALQQLRPTAAQTPGTWIFRCHVSAHLAAGMYAHDTVEPAIERPMLTRETPETTAKPSAKREKSADRNQP